MGVQGRVAGRATGWAKAGLLASTFVAGAIGLTLPAVAGSHLESENAELKNKVEDLEQEVQILKNMVLKNTEMAKAAQSPKAPEKMVQSGNKNVNLAVSGQVNRMVFYADDGDQARFFQSDNDWSSTRVRFVGNAKITDDLSAMARVEVQFESNSGADVTIDQNKAVGTNNFTERKLEVRFKSKRAGALWLGQGDTASNGALEEDLSGTTTISGSAADTNGSSLGFVVSGTNGTQSGVTVGDHFSNLDGLSRDDRLRYDTPTFAGFQGSASWVDGDEFDVALRFGREFGGFEVAGAVAYWDAQSTDDKTGYGGSASVLAPFGTSLTVAYGEEDLDLVAATADSSGQADVDPEFYYVKLGQQFKVFDFGKTSFSIDWFHSEDQNEDDGSEGDFYTLAVEQDVKPLGADLYGMIGQFDLDLASGVDTEEITIGAVGARIKF